MKLVLDTHALLWFAWNDKQLSSAARLALSDPKNELFLSVASLFELAIKINLGKLQLGCPLGDFFKLASQHLEFSWLTISVAHAEHYSSLPLHHRDPFDRMLASQTLIEQWSLVSGDLLFDAYGVPRIW